MSEINESPDKRITDLTGEKLALFEKRANQIAMELDQPIDEVRKKMLDVLSQKRLSTMAIIGAALEVLRTEENLPINSVAMEIQKKFPEIDIKSIKNALELGVTRNRKTSNPLPLQELLSQTREEIERGLSGERNDSYRSAGPTHVISGGRGKRIIRQSKSLS